MRINRTVIFLSLIVCLTSCSTNSFSYDDKNEVSVVLISDEHYQVVDHNQKKDEANINVAHLLSDESVNYTIGVEKNYYVSGVSYEDSQVFFIGNSQYSITLNNVKYSTRVTVYVEPINGETDEGGEPIDESDNEITYDANGGEYILSNGLPMNKVIYSTIHHPRPNTSIGTDIMYRDGYTQIGWNTKSDLSGEHIGLGSRYLDVNNHTFTLYAEWSKYTDKANFGYHVVNEEEKYIVIDKYVGKDTNVTVPEYIDGVVVTTIGNSAFHSCQIDTVILPKSITKIGQLAFTSSTLRELYFFDNLVDVSDGCFMNCYTLTTIHINAILPPKYTKLDRNVTYADKVDRLIVNQGKKKIIILGGSGAFYSVDACILKKLYPDYEPFNLAVNGWFNNYIQLDVIDRFIEDGDVLLHVVESCGKYQFLTTNEMGDFVEEVGYDSRFFNALESNYDLISYTDMKNINNFFNVFSAYNQSKAKRLPKKYTDYTNYADERGDYSSNPEIRINNEPHPIYSSIDPTVVIREASISQEGSVDTNCYNAYGMNKLCGYYQRFASKGVSMYFAFACVNKQSLLKEESTPENLEKYETEVKGYLSKYVTIVNSINDVLLPVDKFADTDWHLKYEYAVDETIVLADKMGALK